MIVHTGFLHRLLFPSLIWSMPGNKVFLTFDDGPHPTATVAVLDVLQRHSIKATFFLSGKNIAGRESIVERIEREGHSIGIHGFHHVRWIAFSKRHTADEIRSTREILSRIVRQPIRLYRPPFGFFTWRTTAAAKELGVLMVMWSCLTGDYRKIDNRAVIKNVLNGIRAGSILVFHDNDLTQQKIAGLLESVIAELKQRGYSFGAIR